MRLSDRNNKIQTTARPQSPQVAGMQVTLPPGSQIPSGWVELNGQTLTGAQNAYPDLWAASPAAWKSGSDLVLPDGPRSTVEVDLDIGGTNSISSSLAKGICYQSSSGSYRLVFNIYYSSSPVNATLPTVAGVVFESGNPQACSVALNTVSTISEAAAQPAVNFIKVEAGTNRSTWRVSGDVTLNEKPTDAFVGADARFSTFDEALEGIPCIKLYSDTTSAVSVGISEATATEAGVVKANRTQQILLPSNFNVTGSTTTITPLSFNSLIIGKRYLIKYKFSISFGNNSAVINIAVNNGASQVADLRQASNNNIVSSRFGEIEFTASSSTVSVIVNNAGGVNSTINGNNSTIGTYAEITELNNTVETTDFT